MHYKASVGAFPIRADQYDFLMICRSGAQESVCEKGQVVLP